MNDLFTALGLSGKSDAAFTLDTEPVRDNVGIRRIIKSSIRQLEDIEKSFLVDSGRPEYSAVDIDEVINKVKSSVGKRSKTEWSVRELKLASYYITRFSTAPDLFSHALGMLSENWRDSFLSGLAYSLLNGWTIWKHEIREECSTLLRDKLMNYQGRFPKYLKLREHVDFFEDAGPARVCSLLIARNMELEQAPEMLGLTAPNISLTYFSDVIISFIKSKKCDLDEIKEILSKHTLDRTKKLLLAYLIEEADNSGDTFKQSMLCRRAREIMNYDVTLESTWAAFGGASEEERNTLKHCHELVTAWYARRSVETFFEIACQDKDRRNFWLKYVYAVHNFKIVGSSSVRTMLLRDGRITDALRSCFIESRSRSSQTSALVLYIKDKVFVEFSDTGALYVYNPDRKVISVLKTYRSIEKSEDLKQPSIGPLVQQETGWYGNKWFTHSQEGRLPHSGYWQERLDSWLKEMMELRPNYSKGRKKNYTTPSLFQDIEGKPQSSSGTPDAYKPPITTDSLRPKFRDASELPRRKYQIISRTSKSLMDGKVSFVSSSNGYYIHLIRDQTFLEIQKPVRSGHGSIFIKKKDDSGFHRVYHHYDGIEYTLGYVKEEGSKLYFKKELGSIPYLLKI